MPWKSSRRVNVLKKEVKKYTIIRWILRNPVPDVTDNNEIPPVLAFHPLHFRVRDLIRKNFHILKNVPETSAIFSNNPQSLFNTAKTFAP